MAFLSWLEGLRLPFITELMLLITHLGEETAFLLIALVVYWCINKRLGYYILSVGFIGTVANQFLKMLFRVPRPWILNPEFTAVEAAKAEATGFSFPSGHTQSSVGTFGAIAFQTKYRWARILCICMAVLVPFSRMYLGVHTPQDVLVSVIIALLLIFVVYPFIFGDGKRRIKILFAGMILLSAGYLLFVHLYPFPSDVDQTRLTSGIESGYTLFGCMIGLVVVYFVDKKWLNFQVKAKWWAQIIKVILGVALVLAVKSGLKTPLNMLAGEYIGRAIRYFLMVIVAGILWPLSFQFFAKIGDKEC